MVSKVLERIHAESAARLLGHDWQLLDIPEPLDFEVRANESVFGLEVRQVFADQEVAYGSPMKRREAMSAHVIRDLASDYYARGGSPVSARFLGSLRSADCKSIVSAMLDNAVTYPNGRCVFKVERVKVYLTAVPPDMPEYRHWLCIDHRVGWLRDATSSELQAAVDRKAGNLHLYRQKFSEIVLLLVADRAFNSGRIRAHEHLSIENPGYSAIYFLSHPEAVIRVA